MTGLPEGGLGRRLRETLAAGAALLTDAARRDLGDALRHDRLPSGLARGRDGEADLYYTLFHVLVADALGMPVDTERMRRGLEPCDPRNLPDVDRACRIWLDARAGGRRTRMRARLLVEAPRAILARLSDPYEVFVWGLATDACGWQMPWFLLAWWAPWNWATTPQAAAVLAVQALAGSALRRGQRAQKWLLEQRTEEGGFRAGPDAPHADLLSTATASFALHLAGWMPDDADVHGRVAFVEACRHGAGHWRDLPEGGDGDVEYSFYALLALGASVRDNGME